MSKPIPDEVRKFYRKLYMMHGMEKFEHPINIPAFSDEYMKIWGEYDMGGKYMVSNGYIVYHEKMNLMNFTEKFVKNFIEE